MTIPVLAGGFSFSRRLDGKPPTPLMRCYHPTGDSVALWPGDIVAFAGDASADGFPTVARAAAGAPFMGLVCDVDVETFDALRYVVASTARYVMVYPLDGYDVLNVQEDSAGGNLALTDVGSCTDMVVANGETVAPYRSKFKLDSNGPVTASGSAQFRIIGLAKKNVIEDGSNAVGTNAYWEVIPNETQFAPGGLGV